MKLATFAAGCFWGVEEYFLASGKCTSTMVGYIGGHAGPSVSYEVVCKGNSGHAEAVQVEFDPAKTKFLHFLLSILVFILDMKSC